MSDKNYFSLKTDEKKVVVKFFFVKMDFCSNVHWYVNVACLKVSTAKKSKNIFRVKERKKNENKNMSLENKKVYQKSICDKNIC